MKALFSAEDKPDMRTLERLNIIQKLSSDWNKMANLLGLPSEVVSTIKRDYPKDSEQACREAFHKWLDGEGCQQITWEELIELLRDARRSTLAQQLEKLAISS